MSRPLLVTPTAVPNTARDARAPRLAAGRRLLRFQQEIHDAVARVAHAKLAAVEAPAAASVYRAQEDR